MSVFSHLKKNSIKNNPILFTFLFFFFNALFLFLHRAQFNVAIFNTFVISVCIIVPMMFLEFYPNYKKKVLYIAFIYFTLILPILSNIYLFYIIFFFIIIFIYYNYAFDNLFKLIIVAIGSSYLYSYFSYLHIYNNFYFIENQFLGLNTYTDIMHDINLSISVGKFGNILSLVDGIPKSYHFFSHWWVYEIGKVVTDKAYLAFSLISQIIIYPMTILTMFYISGSFIKNLNIKDYALILANNFIGLLFCLYVLEYHHFAGVLSYMLGFIIFLPIFFFILNTKITNYHYIFFVLCGLILTFTKTNFGFNLLVIIFLKICFDQKNLNKKIFLIVGYALIFFIFYIAISPHHNNLLLKPLALICYSYNCISFYLIESILPLLYLSTYFYKIHLSEKTVLNKKQLLILYLYCLINYIPGLAIHTSGQATNYFSMTTQFIFVILIVAEINYFYKISNNLNLKKILFTLNVLIFFILSAFYTIKTNQIFIQKKEAISAMKFSNTRQKYFDFAKNFKTIIKKRDYPIILRGNFDVMDIYVISNITKTMVFSNKNNAPSLSPDFITFVDCNSPKYKIFAYFGFYINTEYICSQYKNLNNSWVNTIAEQASILATSETKVICDYIKKLDYDGVYILNEELSLAKFITCK